ncbi:MAG TPA: HAMP domain-containing sensor histidine kinase [Acidimicrobiales bacterium]|nr:HAMP domain-containing sensor histidine kinase [Acidimicrobiales bacterium]
MDHTTPSGSARGRGGAWWPLSLRFRAIVAFGAVSLLLVGTVSTVTYALVRTWIVRDREHAVVRQAFTDARLVRNHLHAGDTGIVPLLSGLQVTENGSALIHMGGRWYSSSIGSGQADVPRSLRSVVGSHHAGWQTVSTGSGPLLAVGVPIVDSSAAFYVLESMSDVDRTLQALAVALALAAGIATIVGAGTGALVSRRILQPLRDVSTVAERISEGASDARLEESPDPDLEPLITSFNRMVDELDERARREARFAADVSHDLRGPLAAFSSAVAVVHRRRGTLPPEACAAVDVLGEQVEAFNRLVVDLLEISRFDAGSAVLDSEEVDAVEFVRAVVSSSRTPVPVTWPPDFAPRILVDKRRLQRVIVNLLENADHYAGGPTAVSVTPAEGGRVSIAVEDRGPGVSVDLRESIFTRYDRGRADRDPTMPKGTGLGLALASQHVELHGGSLHVEDNPGGGARFVIELPGVAR